MPSSPRVTIFTVVVVAAMALAGCAPAVVTPPTVTYSAVPNEDRDPAPTPPVDPRPAVVWPLTGLSAEGAPADQMDRPALSIKIENSSFAKPQTNLQYADTVYETYVEYGISRLIAIYHSDYPESVGPVRSMRPMDQFIMGSYGGPLIFSGAQRRFITLAQNTGTDLIAQDLRDYGFFRVNTNFAPHNLHGTLEDFREQAVNQAAPPEQYLFAYPAEYATANVDGTPATHIDIWMSSYARPEWTWDAAQHLWLRWEDKDPHVTYDGTQLFATNVVVLWVPVEYTSHEGGTAIPESLVAGEDGNGWVAANGKYVPITWSKASRTDPFVLHTLDGEAVLLEPGNTWVELVPRSGTGSTSVVEFDDGAPGS